MTSNVRRCKDCEFYLDDGQDDGEEQCRFNAPVPSLKSATMNEKFFSEVSITWPRVGPDDWCGQFSSAAR